jgi:hypothetical protein
LVEEADGEISIFEMKYNEKKKPKFPATFINSYPVKQQNTVNRENYFDFLQTE